MLKKEKRMLLALAKSNADEQYVYETRGGWLEPAVTFVLRDGAISANTTNIIGVSPSYTNRWPWLLSRYAG